MAGAAPTPLERLLTERVVLCWMALHHAELVYAQRLGTLTLEQGAYLQERLARFQKMYLAAIKALAQLRRVAVTVARVSTPTAGTWRPHGWRADPPRPRGLAISPTGTRVCDRSHAAGSGRPSVVLRQRRAGLVRRQGGGASGRASSTNP